MSFLAFVQKDWNGMLFLTLIVSGVLLVWPLLSRRLSGGRDIGTLGVTQLMNSKNPVLLDLRETKGIAGAKLPNAVQIPFAQLKTRGGELAKLTARPLVAYCDRGQRARSASSLLAKLGFQDVYFLQGGFRAWKDAGLPVQKV